jgi:hypothetical protein
MSAPQQRIDAQFRILRLLEDQPEASQRDIARSLGVSLGLVNFCLKALADKGCLKVANFRASGSKLRYAYLLTPEGMQEKARMTAGFLQRKVSEYEALKAEIAALQAEAGSPVGQEAGSALWLDGSAPVVR